MSLISIPYVYYYIFNISKQKLRFKPFVCAGAYIVFEKADYPRKDNSNYPYSFFSNLLPLLISAIGKLNKINILFDNRRVFRGFTMRENKKTLGYE